MGKIKHFLLIFSLAIAISGCIDQTLVDNSQSLSNEVWLDSDTMVTKFQIGDTSKEYHMDLTMRFTNAYEFSNFYVLSVLEKPNGELVDQVKSFDVTDKAGKWLGSGFGDIHSYEFPLYEIYTTDLPGTYRLKVVQYMRKESLVGCKDRGIRIRRGREKF